MRRCGSYCNPEHASIFLRYSIWNGQEASHIGQEALVLLTALTAGRQYRVAECFAVQGPNQASRDGLCCMQRWLIREACGARDIFCAILQTMCT